MPPYPYLLILGALYVGATLAALAGAGEAGALLFPIPVALYLARGGRRQAGGLVACAGLSALTVTSAASGPLAYMSVAALGVPLGLGILRQWRYGRAVAALAGLAFMLLLVDVISRWEAWRAQGEASYEALAGVLAQQGGNGMSEQADLLRERLGWFADNWANLGLGMYVWLLLTGACLGAAFADQWAKRRLGMPGLRGSFREMRVPDWLVWVVIAVALAWFLERRWPVDWVRVVVWNSAVALFAIYWVNGVSIVAHAGAVLKPPFLLAFALSAMLILAGLNLLGLVGLFDTWGDFRARIDRLAAARKARRDSDSGQM